MAHRMSDEQYAALERWVREKITRGCPYCGAGHWQISNEIFIVPYVDPNTPGVFPDHGLAYALVTCGGCAATIHLSVPEMGIFEVQE